MIEKGYVYFIESNNEYLPSDILIIKIGKTGVRQSYNCKINQYDVGKIVNRKKELQIASAFELNYLALLKITSNVGRAERYIHANISKLGYIKKMKGEWYSLKRMDFPKLLIDIRNMVNQSQSDNSYYIDVNVLDEKIIYARNQIKKSNEMYRKYKKYYKQNGTHPVYDKATKSFLFEIA